MRHDCSLGFAARDEGVVLLVAVERPQLARGEADATALLLVRTQLLSPVGVGLREMVLRWLASLAWGLGLVIVLLTVSALPARADDRLLLADPTVSNLDGYGGVLAWDQGVDDGNGGVTAYRIAVRERGRVRVLGRRFSQPVGPDVGTDRHGRPVLVYSDCSRRGCGLVTRDVRTGRERRVRVPGDYVRCSDGGAIGASSPSISHGRIVYVLSACRGGSDRVMLRLASGAIRTLVRIHDDGSAGSTDIAGNRVLFSEASTYEPVIGVDVGSKVLLTDTRGSYLRVIGHAYHDGMTSDAVSLPVLASGSAYFLETADDGASRGALTLHRVPLQGFPHARLCDYTQGLSADTFTVTGGHLYFDAADNEGIFERVGPMPTKRRCRPPYAVGFAP